MGASHWSRLASYSSQWAASDISETVLFYNMKFTLPLVITCLLSVPVLAQVFRLDSLPKEGFSVSKGWRWQAGNNPSWAGAAFDDSRWDTIRAPLTADSP